MRTPVFPAQARVSCTKCQDHLRNPGKWSPRCPCPISQCSRTGTACPAPGIRSRNRNSSTVSSRRVLQRSAFAVTQGTVAVAVAPGLASWRSRRGSLTSDTRSPVLPRRISQDRRRLRAHLRQLTSRPPAHQHCPVSRLPPRRQSSNQALPPWWPSVQPGCTVSIRLQSRKRFQRNPGTWSDRLTCRTHRRTDCSAARTGRPGPIRKE